MAAATITLTCLGLSPMAQGACQNGCGNTEETFLGDTVLLNVTTGNRNTGVGFNALQFDTTGFENTAVGRAALDFNTTGYENTALGADALLSNTSGFYNTATGFFALFSNTVGAQNTATGDFALEFNTTGIDNTADGAFALQANTSGYSNTGIGYYALLANTTGHNNTATGLQALESNTTGTENTATGVNSMVFNTIGINNTADGVSALYSNTTGTDNTACGANALNNNTTGTFNIGIGRLAGSNLTTGSNNIDIGSVGVAGESNSIRIGTSGTQTATYIAGISGAAIGSGLPVRVSASGKLGTAASSARFKEAIKPMDKSSEAIFALEPVTFRYKKDLDPDGIPQFGLVAEQVEKVNPNLVANDEKGKPYTVRYDAVNAMLLNEFLKEHRTVQEEQVTIGKLQSALGQQEKEIKALTSSLQKVNNQLELMKPAPRVVANQ